MSGIRHCMHCGGQMSSAASSCPWCGRSRGSGAIVEFFFGGVIAIGLGTIAAIATGVITSEQVSNAVYSVVDRAPAPPPGQTTGSVERAGSSDDMDVDTRSDRVRQQAASLAAGREECADLNTLRGLVQRYRDWADGDLALIACGQIRSGFSGDQVIAAIGQPPQRVARSDGTEEWRYGARRVVIRQGRVVDDSSE